MFLMNTSPLVALQRKWEPFAQARACRYPVCFSESEDDIARTSVSTKVQMIINNLQSEESSLGTTSEYGCILQKKRKGVKIRAPKRRGDGRMLPQGCAKYAPRSCPADSDGMEVEESSEFGPLSLNSDSDDSVDREIEEAIQEYLKQKGQCIPPLPNNAKSLPSTNAGKSLRKEDSSYGVACNVFPGSVKTDVIPQPLAPDFLGDDALQWVPSPCSVSSDDSFEQSIKAEIEQFLNEKKQRARKQIASGGSKSLDQKEVQEKATSQKGGTSKASPHSLKRGGKAYFLRRHPELQNTSSPPKCWMPKTEELVNVRKTNLVHLSTPGAGHSCIREQSNGSEIRQRFWKARGEQGPESASLSDSSSDDGIEEAIQLYQLEKVRKAANAQVGCVPSQKEEFGAGGLADISASLTIHSEKSALPENPRTALSSKRKQTSSKLTELNRTGAICNNELGKGRRCSSPANDVASGAVPSQTCRADTAAELMCAEAILDISKTILPPSVTSDGKSVLTDPFFHFHSVSPPHQESDSNAVDSDDSIEQEIRAFLAIKAQAEHSITKSGEASNAAPNTLSCGHLDDRIRSPKQSFPNTLKLPLDHKRQLKEESSVSRQRQDEKMALLKVDCSHLETDKHSKHFASQKENFLSNVENGEAGRAARQPGVTPAAASTVDFVTPLSQGLLGTGGLLKNARQPLQKCSIDDKSSSLDSDEDLDTAIKDLLRSKRKLKKKSKDQNIQCKKKVRFGNAEMHIFEEKLEVLQEKACKSKNPALLKSCLIRSRRNIWEESAQTRSPYMVKGRPRRAETTELALTFEKRCQAISGPDIQAAAVSDQQHWIDVPMMEDSSSLDSDDSIEQEIQRFLAEKARDSSSTVEIVGAFEIVDTVKAAQPQTAQPKLEGGGTALSKRNKRAKKGRQPMTELRSPLRTEREGAENICRTGEQTVTCREDIHSQAIVKLQGNQGVVRAKGAGLSVKRMGIDRKGVSDGKLVQRSLSSWKEKAENGKPQNYFKPMSLFRRKSSREFKISSKFITGFKRAQKKEKSVLLRKSQSIELSVPQSRVFRRQEGLLGEIRKAPAQKGILGSKSKTEKADLYQRCMAGEFYPPVAEKMEVAPLSIGVASPAKAKPFGEEEHCSLADAKQSSLLQEPSVDGAKGIDLSSSPSQIPVKEKEGRVQGHSNSWEGLGAPESCNPPLRERLLLTRQDRIAEKPTHKDFEGGSAEFIDVPVVAHAPCLEKNKPTSLCLVET
ncbi:PREDICTED: protein phosphatase 1 regulatory subunit 26 isoform X2 [Gekko japonicus]|uniref:Protein phosphatase 1 regulatory subunit 26 isoform X2 n=1 Tax=Gekko japonicus TaxID=146911 RepID=A0ABM1KFV4_GEKJA|nr:PREDICTED: protein phosphatase 1 regulatory subunit 26 isoform X2 [Gekko japonicus]